MAFFTKIDENNIVKQIEVVENSIATTEQAGIEFLNNLYGKTENCKQMGTAPFVSNGKTITRSYAGINFTYDESRDAFIEPKLYNSWILNETTYRYEAPVTFPDDGNDYVWNEETTSWDLLE